MLFPKISIITVCYNAKEYLEETIKSVLSQTYQNIEYIIIDGMSTDGTLDIINMYANQLSYWVSEQDDSMYEAINKGLRKCTGDYIWILNADDCIHSPTTVYQVIEQIRQNPGYIGYYGNIMVRTNEKTRLRRSFQVTREQLLLSAHGTFVPHPALIVSSESLTKIPDYNIIYSYASDFDYILNLMQNGNLKFLSITLSVFRRHSNSITSSGKIDSDRLAIIKHQGYYNYNIIYRYFLFLVLWLKYKIINFKISKY